MSETIRSFIAVDIDQSLKTAIKEIQSELSKSGCLVKWVAPANAHLTLKFLGDIEKTQVPTIKECLEKTLKRFAASQFQPTHLGAFPSARFPKIVWIGLEEDGTIKKIAKHIDIALKKMRFPKEKRKFSAHITIGRVKSTKNIKRFSKQIQEFPALNAKTQQLDHISFYQSTLDAEGPTYDCLFQIPLQENEN